MRNIPTVTRYLLIVNVLAFLACLLYGQDAYGNYKLNSLFGLHYFMASDFHVYQLVTYMFMHGGFYHILFNMFALWMFGCIVERVWGGKKFLFYYLCCGIGAGLFQEAAQLATYYAEGLAQYQMVSVGGMQMSLDAYLNNWTTVGASGAIYAILLAFGMLFPDEKIFIIPIPIPIKAKWFVIIYAGIELFSVISMSNDGVAHLAHLGGMVFGYFLIRYWRNHPGGSACRTDTDIFGKAGKIFGHGREKTAAGTGDWWQRTAEETSTRTSDDVRTDRTARTSQEEIDRILDKIRKSGYDSLSSDEKQKLFDQSR